MQALRTGRVNHAYLFSGPRGCGKTTSARILARCLNCEQGPTPEPCGECDSCVALARGGSGTVDVIEIDAASHGGVDDARDLRERASYGPAQSRYKIYIIDEAHMVTPQGFNALLKIVEEPPEHVKFVFATTEPEKVIGTIRSRTHHYPFRLVPPARLQAYMEELCVKEGVAVAPGVLSFVVRAGGGSVRDSLSVLDQLIAGSGPEGLTYESAAALLGFTDGELLDAAIDAFAAGDAASVFRSIDKVVETGLDPRRFVEDLLERLRDLIVVAAVTDGAGSVLRHVPEDQLERMRLQAAAFGPGALSRAADVVNAGLTEMTGATAPRLQLELIAARILLPGAAGEAGYAARLDRLERRLDVGGVPTAAVSYAAPRRAAAPAARADLPRLLRRPPRRPPRSRRRPFAAAERTLPGRARAAGRPRGAARARRRAPARGPGVPAAARTGSGAGRRGRPRARAGRAGQGPRWPRHRRAAPLVARRARLAEPQQAGHLDLRRAERPGARLRRPAGAARHLDRGAGRDLPARCPRRLRAPGPDRRARGRRAGRRRALRRRRGRRPARRPGAVGSGPRPGAGPGPARRPGTPASRDRRPAPARRAAPGGATAGSRARRRATRARREPASWSDAPPPPDTAPSWASPLEQARAAVAGEAEAPRSSGSSTTRRSATTTSRSTTSPTSACPWSSASSVARSSRRTPGERSLLPGQPQRGRTAVQGDLAPDDHRHRERPAHRRRADREQPPVVHRLVRHPDRGAPAGRLPREVRLLHRHRGERRRPAGVLRELQRDPRRPALLARGAGVARRRPARAAARAGASASTPRAPARATVASTRAAPAWPGWP